MTNMDITTYQTAKRLKEAGFPQPEFQTGQLWYNQHKALSFIGKKEIAHNGQVFFFCTSVVTARTEQMIPINDGAFFAPTATDILREIESVTFYWHAMRGKFSCSGGSNEKLVSWVNAAHENPAEAAASAWLAINEK